MILYRDIIDYIIHTIYCDACGKELKIKLKKTKFPHPNDHSGAYWYKGKVVCNDCKTENNYKFPIFYVIRTNKGGNPIPTREKFMNSYKHRSMVHCRKCNGFKIIDCQDVGCEFYGIMKWHKLKPEKEDYWWAIKLSKVEKWHDKYYSNKYKKWKKKTEEESKDCSKTQTIKKSSES